METHYEIAKEELAFYDKGGTSLQNLIAILIGPKANPVTTGKLSSLGINNLSNLSIDELKEYEGIGTLSARRIISSFGLAKTIIKYKKENEFAIKSPDDAAKYLSDLQYEQQEMFDVLFLNTKNIIISRKNIFKGSLNSSIVHPREIFREAIRLSSASIIISHNHPSGHPDPSREDITITKRIYEAGKMIGIELLDHIIIGNNKFVSLKEKGMI